MRTGRLAGALFALAVLAAGKQIGPPCLAAPKEDAMIPLVVQMPSQPSPYEMRDWLKAARNYVDLSLDPTQHGDMLPLVRPPTEGHGPFMLPAYVGGESVEAVACLATVVSGALVGMDMTNYHGYNWVEACQSFFSSEDGVYANSAGKRVGGTFWYDILPSVLFYQLADRYPRVGDADRQFRSVAEQWRRACEAMGGKVKPFALPNFDHTGFWFDTMAPVDNGQWIEPEGAAGIAWLEYMAYVRTGDASFLQAADWCVRALQDRPLQKNPLYEVLLPYGAVVAARMNAELGRDYDVPRLVNWCFDGGRRSETARRNWGVLTRKFGRVDAHGLVGDINGWGFAMNTFEYAGALAPIVRYDARYAHDIGKWMLNLANAARLFYPAYLEREHQDCADWARRYDPNGCLCYETVASSWRAQALRHNRFGESFRRIHGSARRQGEAWILESEPANGLERLEHVWRFCLPMADHYTLHATARSECAGGGSGKVLLFWANAPDGPFHELCTVAAGRPAAQHAVPLPGAKQCVYLKALADAGATHLTLHLGRLELESTYPDVAPYGTGDASIFGAPSNLAIYGSAHVGNLGCLIGRTSDARVLKLDLLATDHFHARAYPTYLLYSPYQQSRKVRFRIGPTAVDLYDAVTHRIVAQGVKETAVMDLQPDSAMVLVEVPQDAVRETKAGRLVVGGITVDFSKSDQGHRISEHGQGSARDDAGVPGAQTNN